MSCFKNQIDVLASLVHPRNRGKSRNRFVMIEAYFDESGIHNGAAVCVVGGFYGTQAAWRTFEKQWNRIISDFPELKNTGFHAKDFFRKVKGQRIGPYENWDDDKARRFLERLVQTIMRNRIFPVAYGVIVKDFMAFPLQDRKWFTGGKFSSRTGKAITSGCPDRSYYLPFTFCVLASAKMSGANKTDKIHFFAGLDRSFHEYASTLYKFTLTDSRLPQSIKDLLGTIGYPLAKDTPGIQAADLLVHRLYRFLLEKIAENKNLPPPPLIAKLSKNIKPNQRFELFDSTRLRRLQELGKAEYEKLLREGRLADYVAGLKKS